MLASYVSQYYVDANEARTRNRRLATSLQKAVQLWIEQEKPKINSSSSLMAFVQEANAPPCVRKVVNASFYRPNRAHAFSGLSIKPLISIIPDPEKSKFRLRMDAPEQMELFGELIFDRQMNLMN